jgi:hypothetical protein
MAWTKIDKVHEPAGQGRDLAFRLVKDEHHGSTRWVAVSRPLVKSNLYFILRAYWNEKVGCRHIDRAAWTFHVAP